MIPKECNIIGKGGHWIVERITIKENDKEVSVVRKHGKLGKADDNITAFNLVFKAGLPTLNRYVKKNDLVIEAEDLNTDASKGLFVSPNTVRACPTYADLLINIIKLKDLSEAEKEFLNESFFQTVLQQIKQGNINTEDIERLREKRIVTGAEGEVYNNKIKLISNLEPFWLKIKNDIKKAALHHIELFPDAFFFRVNITGQIEYTIADFDCIRDLSRYEDCYDDLIKGNTEHYKTALWEYIDFFVIEEKRIQYHKLLNSFT